MPLFSYPLESGWCLEWDNGLYLHVHICCWAYGTKLKQNRWTYHKLPVQGTEKSCFSYENTKNIGDFVAIIHRTQSEHENAQMMFENETEYLGGDKFESEILSDVTMRDRD